MLDEDHLPDINLNEHEKNLLRERTTETDRVVRAGWLGTHVNAPWQ